MITIEHIIICTICKKKKKKKKLKNAYSVIPQFHYSVICVLQTTAVILYRLHWQLDTLSPYFYYVLLYLLN